MPAHGDVKVFYNTQDGSDYANTDYTASGDQDLTFSYDSSANDGHGGYDPQIIKVDTSPTANAGNFSVVIPCFYDSDASIPGGSDPSATATIERVQMNPFKMVDSQPTTEVTAVSEKQGTGVYIPLSDAEYAQEGQKDLSNSLVVPGGDPDLLPVELHAISPASLGGSYTLEIPSGIRVWLSSDRKGLLSAGQTISATQDTTLYVEADQTGAGKVLAVDWTPAGGATQSKVDWIKLNVFTIGGPIYVPELSTYQYSASGGASSAHWLSPSGGAVVAPPPPAPAVNLFYSNQLTVKWGTGPSVGVLTYQAAPDFVWDRSLYVVGVTIASPPLDFKVGSETPFRSGNAVSFGAAHVSQFVYFITATAGVRFAASPKDAGMVCAASVTFTGPDNNRGVDKLRAGFVQYVTDSSFFGDYSNNKTLTRSVEGNTYTDNISKSIFCSERDAAYFDDASAANRTKTITFGDSPGATFPIYYEQYKGSLTGTHPITHLSLLEDFATWVVVQLKDPQWTNSSGPVTTGLASINWTVDINAPIVRKAGSSASFIAADGAIEKVSGLSDVWIPNAYGADLRKGSESANDALKRRPKWIPR